MIHLNERGVAQLRPRLPRGPLTDRRRTQALRILDDGLVVQLEQIAASQHVEHAGRIPIEPLEGRLACTGCASGETLLFIPFKSMA